MSIVLSKCQADDLLTVFTNYVVSVDNGPSLQNDKLAYVQMVEGWSKLSHTHEFLCRRLPVGCNVSDYVMYAKLAKH